MNSWGDAGLLVELLDRQFIYFLGLRGTPQVIRLAHLCGFLDRESRIAGVLGELRSEASEVLKATAGADDEIRAELTNLWDLHSKRIRTALAQVKDDQLSAYGDMPGFDERVRRRPSVAFPMFDEETDCERATSNLVKAFVHWSKWITDTRKSRANKVLLELQRTLEKIAGRNDYNWRRLHEAGQSLAWPCFERLQRHLNLTNPIPPTTGDALEAFRFERARVFADVLRKGDDGELSAVEDNDVTGVYESIVADARLLHEELRLRIGLGRTRLATIHRYAARCEAFDASHLREIADRDPGNAERTLTLHFARYLFDEGFLPLIDPTVGGLRPDILDVGGGSPLYVEAKQYDDGSPRATLLRAYTQVRGTWARVRKTYPETTEAFLVVFRRRGPLVELPPLLRYDGLRLYSVVVDISEKAGSRDRERVIRITESDLA